MKLLLETGQVNLDSRTYLSADGQTRLSRIETALLGYLASRPKETISREELYEQIWNYKEGLQTRTLDLAVSRLRKKVERNPQEPVHLMTVYGSGYAFIPLGEDASELEAKTSVTRETRSNLTPEHTSFFGRQAELAQLDELTRMNRGITTVLGPPGTGKTRLVKQWASQQVRGGEYESLWFCDLTEARTELGVLQGVASGLNTPLTGNDTSLLVLTRQLGYTLAGLGRSLIIIDNVEQVIAFSAEAIKQWRTQAPDAVFLFTSQVPLGLPMEQRLPLAPFSISTSQLSLEESPALQLFVDRAQNVRPSFTLTEENREDIIAIIKALDGLPLAIELAASRIHLMSANAIHQRLGKRFQLLRRNARAGSGRHETLQAALSWAWELLQPWEQLALAQCSVFVDGFDWEAVEAVIKLEAFEKAPWGLDVVSELVERSLISVRETSTGGVRLYLLVSIAAFAEAKFQELSASTQEDAQRRHAQYYGRLGSPAYLSYRSGKTFSVHHQLSTELENIVSGIERCLRKQWYAEATALWPAAFLQLRNQGPLEKALLLIDQLMSCETSKTFRANLHHHYGSLQKHFGERESAREQFRLSLQLFQALGDHAKETDLLHNLGVMDMHEGKVDAARDRLDRALKSSLEVDDCGHRESQLLGTLGNLELNMGRWDEALAYYKRQQHAIPKDNQKTRIYNLTMRGWLATLQNRLEDAKAYLSEALSLSRVHFGTPYSEVGIRTNLAKVSIKEENWAQAEAELMWAIKVGDPVWPSMSGACRGLLAPIRAREGLFEEARTLLREGEELIRDVHSFEHGKLFCQRAEVEILAGAYEAAKNALHNAETHSLGPETELGQKIQAIQKKLEKARQ